MDPTENSKALRDNETTAARTADGRMSVDPGFVHHRLIQNLLGKAGVDAIAAAMTQVPPSAPEPIRQLQIDHIYVDALVMFCSHIEVPSLLQLLSNGTGKLFASVETVAPCPEVYSAERVAVTVRPKADVDLGVRLEFATERIASDTTRMELAQGGEVAIIGQVRQLDETSSTLIIEPLVIGGPSLEPAPSATVPDAMWLGYSFGEVFPEDIDQFAAIREIPIPDDISVMQTISEAAVKSAFAELLSQEAGTDWGGERSGLYSAHLHLNGRRTIAAFLLKGPAKFRQMRLTHLGKNNDQIVRLASEPAELLVVQHSHEIGPEVRATLRAFATSLGTVRRRYCFIDGADTLRILRAYRKLDRAIES